MNFQVVVIRHCNIHLNFRIYIYRADDVKPLKKGHIGDVHFVPSREIVFFGGFHFHMLILLKLI